MENRFLIAPLLVILALVFSGCGLGESKPEKLTGLVVINVLDKPLYDDCHIKGSINVPFEMIEEFAGKLDTERVEVVLYCSNYQCATSEYAAQKLRERGCAKVTVYEGGMAEWYQNNLPVNEGPHKEAYLMKPSRRLHGEQQGMLDTEVNKVESISMEQLAQKMGFSEHINVAA